MKARLLAIGLAYKTVVFALLFVTRYLPDFDQSSPFVYSRWDTIHYSSLAENGYAFEHQWAFFPGIPLISALFPSQLAAGVLIGLTSLPTITTLYDLSYITLGSADLAYTSSLLSIFTSS